MEKQTSKRPLFLPALILFSLAGQIAWVVENMYLNVFMYKMFGAGADSISLMVAASAVSATLTTLLIGALSDKLGRRKVFIVVGYMLWGVSILGFALIRRDVIEAVFPAALSVSAIGVTLVIVMDCIMTFFGSAANDACFNAWLTDATTEKNRGRAEGINAMMPLVAILAVFGGFMAFDLGQENSWRRIFLIIGTVMLAVGFAGIFLIRENTVKREENAHYFQNIIYGLRPSVMRENGGFYLLLAGFALFGISIQVFMPYLILYYEVSLGMRDYVLIMAPAILLASGFTVFYGRIYDRYRFRWAILPAMGLLFVGYGLLFLFRTTAPVFVGSLLMMCGYLSGAAVFGAALRDHTPEGKAGMFQGLRIIGQVLIPGVVGPAIGAAVLANAKKVLNQDGTESFIPHAGIFLAAGAVALVLLGYLLLLFTTQRKLLEKDKAQP